VPSDPLGVVIDFLLCDPEDFLSDPSKAQNFLRSGEDLNRCKLDII